MRRILLATLMVVFTPVSAQALCFKAESVVNTSATPCLSVLTSAGNWGIGTLSPAYKVHVTGTIYGDVVHGLKYGTSTASVETVSGNYSPTKYVYGFNENRGWGYNSADDAVYYAANESVPIVIRGTDGRVGIGTTQPNGRLHIHSSVNETKIYVTGYGGALGYGIAFRAGNDSATRPLWFTNTAGTLVGSVETNASSTIYNTTSDHRLKENLTPIPNALDRVGALNPVAYNFKNDPDVRTEGFLAHEIQAVAPYAVSGEKDALDADGTPIYQQVDYGKLTPLLAASIQELRAESKDLKTENKELKHQVNEMQQQLDTLKAAIEALQTREQP